MLVSETVSDTVREVDYVQAFCLGIGQVMFQENLLTGLFFLAGIGVNSWTGTFYTALGTLLPVLFAVFWGIDPEMLNMGLMGYNGVLCALALGGKTWKSWLRRQFSLAFYGILQRMSRIDILPNVGDFRLLDRRCVLTLRRLRECERYTKGLFCWIGYQKKSIEFDRGDRLMGHSSWNFLKLLNLAVEGITSFSIAPLRIATVCGVLCSISSFISPVIILLSISYL